MIRINLLPVRQTQKQQTIQQQLLAGAALLIVTVIGCVVWTAAIDSTASEKKAAIEEKQTELKQLDKIIGEVNEFSTRKKELEDKLGIIEKLKKGKTGPVRALDDLATEIPNRVWLTAMEEKAGTATLEGLALEHDDVSALMKALQKSKFFKGVLLLYSKAKPNKATGFTIYEFKITCKVDYSA
ncbi:MAG: PilN domain-containing protein [Deltaproteobacteria bacterium]|nr:PilN domain-containing protein [Deltaproteobacteria bacterium]